LQNLRAFVLPLFEANENPARGLKFHNVFRDSAMRFSQNFKALSNEKKQKRLKKVASVLPRRPKGQTVNFTMYLKA